MHSGHGVGVLDAHLTLQAVGVAEEDAEDGAEVGDEAVAGAPGDQLVPDLAERAEGGGVRPEVVMGTRDAAARCSTPGPSPMAVVEFSFGPSGARRAG